MLVLLDRDGVIVEERNDYVKSPAELSLIPGAAHAIARLNEAGHKVVVITNQSVVGRGIIPISMLHRIHEHLQDQLHQVGARLDHILFAPDPPWEASDRRKPGPGMLLEAIRMFRASPQETVMIGDYVTDLQAALRANVRRILVRSGRGMEILNKGIPFDVLPVTVHENLAESVADLLGEMG